ncbi:ferredoxin [Nitzschia inconspicua]|uniref:Ferredoxin n=1 Tax=Nitzschia inconspicua TaxID=303405 RepID=A0A9K3LT83_9STRA|nr:ferredoxin [Nitzschia inconspicua]
MAVMMVMMFRFRLWRFMSAAVMILTFGWGFQVSPFTKPTVVLRRQRAVPSTSITAILPSHTCTTLQRNLQHKNNINNNNNNNNNNNWPLCRLSSTNNDDGDNTTTDDNIPNEDDDGRIDVSIDPRLYRIRLSRAPGIEWGTDLSFSFVYVRDMDPAGQASMSGLVQKGDQLCEILPVSTTTTTTLTTATGASSKPISVLGASFDFVMTSFASLDKTVSEMDLVFFRGTKQELKELCNGEASKSDIDLVTVTVIENKGSSQERLTRLKAPSGTNIRQLLVDNNINVYQSITRWTNCKGKQLCGTCIVNIADGLPNTNWKSMDEASTLRSNPDSYRLSCVAFAHGDVTVETFPPINADQWTR